MAYIRELIGNESQQKIMDDLENDGNFIGLYKRRDGYHEKKLSSLRWAVDKEKNYYLLAAPQLARSREKPFLFYYGNYMHRFHRFIKEVDGLIAFEGYFEENFEDKQYFLSLKTEIEKAHKCYGISSNYDDKGALSMLTVIEKEDL